MDSDSPSATFDPELVERVAADHDLDAGRLRSLADAHQDGMATLPGVENLVYEWRKQFDATVLRRTEDAYWVAAPEWAWAEFTENLDASDEEAAALRALHRRAVTEATGDSIEKEAVTAPMVLLRE